MTEEWRQVTIPGYSHYDVSSLSNVRNSKGHILKPTIQGSVMLYGVTKKHRKLRQYDLQGALMNTFVSGIAASKSLRVSPYRITLCCQGKISLGDFTLQKD